MQVYIGSNFYLDSLQKASEFNKSYDATAKELNDKYNLTGDAKTLSDNLKDRANKIYRITATKTSQLKGETLPLSLQSYSLWLYKL